MPRRRCFGRYIQRRERRRVGSAIRQRSPLSAKETEEILGDGDARILPRCLTSPIRRSVASGHAARSRSIEAVFPSVGKSLRLIVVHASKLADPGMIECPSWKVACHKGSYLFRHTLPQFHNVRKHNTPKSPDTHHSVLITRYPVRRYSQLRGITYSFVCRPLR